MVDVAAPMQWVSTILKLGRKYQVDFMVEEAMRRLIAACPKNNSRASALHAKTAIRDYEGGGMEISIINLARSFDLPMLLPHAFRRCRTQTSVENLIHGVDRGDGTFEHLSSEDLATCIKEREIRAQVVGMGQVLVVVVAVGIYWRLLRRVIQ